MPLQAPSLPLGAVQVQAPVVSENAVAVPTPVAPESQVAVTPPVSQPLTLGSEQRSLNITSVLAPPAGTVDALLAYEADSESSDAETQDPEMEMLQSLFPDEDGSAEDALTILVQQALRGAEKARQNYPLPVEKAQFAPLASLPVTADETTVEVLPLLTPASELDASTVPVERSTTTPAVTAQTGIVVPVKLPPALSATPPALVTSSPQEEQSVTPRSVDGFTQADDVVTAQPITALQVIQALNNDLPLYYTDFVGFVNEVVQTRSFRSGVLQSIEISLQPRDLGKVTAQFMLMENNRVAIALYTQSASAVRSLDSYMNEIQQILAKGHLTLASIQVKQGIPPLRGGQESFSSGQNGAGEFASRYKRGGSSKRRRKDDDLTIDVTV
jgi:flagellar hook-length control protein FliK